MTSSKSFDSFDDTINLLLPDGERRQSLMNPRSSSAPTPKLVHEGAPALRHSSTSRPVLRHHYLTLPRATDIGTHQAPHETKEEKENFKKSEGLSSHEAAELLSKWGPNELESKRTPKWLILLQQFTAPMPIMIWIAIIVEAAIENYADMGILLAIQMINGFLGFYETTRAGDAVEALKASMKPEAVVKRDGKFQKMNASDIVPGDLVLLGSGSAVPADCVVNHGQIDVDQSALTGESLPVTLYAGDSAKMGSTVTRGEVEATVDQTGKNTFFGKTASLLQADTGMGNLQKLLMKIMVVLVVISVTLCVTAFGYLLGEKESLKSALSFTVVLLVASIPVAIEIVVTTTLAMGSRELSKHGAIVTRLAAIEDMAGMKILCSDKTGTLTLNKMVLMENTPVYIEGEDQKSVLFYASMAAKWKEPPRDALDTLVLGSVDMKRLDNCEQIDYMPFDPTIKRTEGTTKLPNGTIVKTTKGAPNILLKLINDENIKKRVENDVSELGKSGIRSLAVAKCQGTEDWKMVGLLTFQDPPRPDTKDTIEKAAEFGVEVKMITGDHLLIAKETARALGMGTNIYDPSMLPSLQGEELTNPPKDLGNKYGEQILRANGFAQVFPEHKFLVVETLRQMGFKVGMTGDGVNDAPALKRADVGVAVQGATDAARSSADIVLTQPGLSTIVHGLMISRQIFQRIKNFLTYRIAATLQLLTFFFIAVFALHPVDFVPKPRPSNFIGPNDWPYFFEMPVLMLMLITLLNDGTLISIGYDNVNPSKHPDKWNLKVLFIIAGVLGSVACGSSLLLLWAALDSWNPNGLFHGMGLSGLGYGQVITTMYLKVSISDFLTLFSSRTTDGFFWTVKPSIILLAAAAVAMSTSTILACLWPDSSEHGIQTEGLTRATPKLMALWVWIYCIIVWLIQDSLKVFVYYLLERYNVFDINGTMVHNHAVLDSIVTDRGVSMESTHDDYRDHTIPVARQILSPTTPNPTPINHYSGNQEY